MKTENTKIRSSCPAVDLSNLPYLDSALKVVTQTPPQNQS